MDKFARSETHEQIREPWNKSKVIGARPPLRPKHVWAVRTRLQLSDRVRDLALFNLAIDSKLRGRDVVGLKVVDVAPHGYALDRASIRQRKTGRPVRFEITEQTRQAIDEYLQRGGAPGPYLFPGRGSAGGHLTTRQYSRLVAEWLTMIGLEACLYGTHSLRRTKATLIYQKTGNLRAVQLLLGHTKMALCVISGSRSTTHLPWPSRSTSEKQRQGRHALPPISRQSRGHLLSSQRPIEFRFLQVAHVQIARWSDRNGRQSKFSVVAGPKDLDLFLGASLVMDQRSV
jgi:hypothetical protein